MRVFYSHWGALSVPLDVFWGPDSTEAFILCLEETGHWLDDVDGEGAVALDKDQKAVAYFGETDLDEPEVQPVFQGLMATVWAEHGWTVARANDMQEIAASVGVDPAIVTSAFSEPKRVDVERLGARFVEEEWYQGLISVRDENSWQDHVVDHAMLGLLNHGPTILEHLHRLPDVDACRTVHQTRKLRCDETQRGTLGDHLSVTVLIDPRERRLACRGKGIYFTGLETETVRGEWPEWHIDWLDRTLVDHIEATGRTVTDEHRPVLAFDDKPDQLGLVAEIQAINKIRAALISCSDQRSDAWASVRQVSRQLRRRFRERRQPWWRRLLGFPDEQREGPVSFSGGFLEEVPTVGTGRRDARQAFERVLAAYRSRSGER